MTLENYIENFRKKYIKSVEIPDEEKENYEFKKLGNKNNVECLYFTEKEFEEYQEEHDAKIIGNVKIRQKKYKNPEKAENREKAYQKKYEKDILGVCRLKFTDDYFEKHQNKLDEPYRDFDLYKSENKHCIGYAWVGENQYVRLVKYNPFIFLIILFLVLGIIFGLCFCRNSKPQPDKTIDDNGTKITEQNTNADGVPIADNHYLYVWKTKTVSSDKKTVALINHPDNKVYLCYDILDEQGNLLDSTGSFGPNSQVDYDFYSLFNGKKGTYNLTLFIKVNDVDTKEDLCTKTMAVEIKVE